MSQWYEVNPSLFEDEKAAMRMRFPKAKLGKLEDGRLYWLMDLTIASPKSPPKCTRIWRIMMVYNSDHPNVRGTSTITDRYGGSVKTYPLNPDIKEMERLWKIHTDMEYPPHILTDEFGNRYLCIEHNDRVAAGTRRGQRITSAADYMAQTARWLTAFELSLEYKDVLNKFIQHDNNN